MVVHKHLGNLKLSWHANFFLNTKIHKTETILKNKGSENATLHIHLEASHNKEFILKIVLECLECFSAPIVLQQSSYILNSLINRSFKELYLKINSNNKKG